MTGFTKGQLSAEFSATGIGFADEKAKPELNNVKLSNEVVDVDPISTKAKIAQDRQKEIELNTAKKPGGAHSIGRIVTGQDQSEKLSPEQQRKKDKQFNELLTRLKEQRIWLLQQLEIIQKEIDELTIQIDEYSRNLEALKLYLNDFEEYGKFDIDEDGYPSDSRVKMLVKEWEKKNNKKWDASAEDADNTLHLIILEQETNMGTKVNERERLMDECQEYWDKIGDIENIVKQEAETGNVNIEEAKGNIEDIEAFKKRSELTSNEQAPSTTPPLGIMDLDLPTPS